MITGPDPPIIVLGISIFVAVALVMGAIVLHYNDDTEYEVEKKDGTIFINVKYTKEDGSYTVLVFKDKTEISIPTTDIKEIRKV